MTNNTEASKKSTTAQAVKAVAVLVIIALVCCLLLALCNDLFYVSDDDKFNRQMAKIYPDFKLDTAFDQTPDGKFANYDAYGAVNKVYKSTDGSYVIEALGNGGYQGGSVTLFVVVGADAQVKGWAVKEHVSQSYLGRVPATAGSTWYVGEDVSNELALNMTGATVKLTSTAINHAVNMAAYYSRNVLGLGKNPEADAKNAVLALLGDSFAAYELDNLSRILTGATNADGTKTVADVVSDGTDVAAYMFGGTGAAGDVLAYVYGTDDLKVVAVTDSGIVATDNVAADSALRTNVAKLQLSEVEIGGKKVSVAIFDVAADGAKTTYKLVSYTVSGWDPTNYTLTVEVTNDGGAGKVTAIEVVKSGNVAISIADTDALATALVGTTSATVMAKYDSDKVTGATQSANIITAAIKTVLATFDAGLAQ